MRYEEFTIEGRNAVKEAFRSGKVIDKLYVQDGCQDGPVVAIKKEAKKHDTIIRYVTRERLDQMSGTGKHQGVIAMAAAISRIPTIWAQSSARPTWRGLTASSSPRTGP